MDTKKFFRIQNPSYTRLRYKADIDSLIVNYVRTIYGYLTLYL